MTIRIVTDSASDIPHGLAQKLGITIVPLTVAFGKDVYRDGVDLSADEFYDKLVGSKALPKTSQPSVATFVDAYRTLAQQHSEIISIHLSSKLSGTYNAALEAKKAVEKDCHVEVVDSEMVSMGAGLIVISAAKAIRGGAHFRETIDIVHQSIPQAHLIAFFQTLKYLEKGGRLGKGKALLGSLLHVKPIITVREGEVQPFGVARTTKGAIHRLYDFARTLLRIRELSIIYTTASKELELLAKLLDTLFPLGRIHIAQAGSTLGTHTGPGTLAVSALVE